MAKLTPEIQTYIVQQLAMYDTPSEVSDAVKQEFGVAISRQAVQVYDPTVGKKPAAKWCALFVETRKRFLEESAKLPIANRAYRLRRLQAMVVEAQRRKNFALAAQLLEQAAKEVGRAYTNRHKIVGDKRAPLAFVFEPAIAKPAGAVALEAATGTGDAGADGE